MAIRDSNLLLLSLVPACRAALEPHLTQVTLRGGERIGGAAAMQRVYFPESMVASFAEDMPDASRVEVGMIGREGVIGWPILLGAAHSPHSGLVQLTGGTALALPAATLLELCTRDALLYGALLRFVQSFTVQMGRTIVANLRDQIDRRLARWLAMLHDRVDGDLLSVTHQALADALNVRRASVTDALHVMEGDGVVRCTRAQLVVRDRCALERLAGHSYGAAEAAYSTLVAPFGKQAPLAPRERPSMPTMMLSGA